ncbi:MAG: ArsI/CadI family heavy metal resistance metalloenzyme [Polyangiaceae bacterium]
MNALKPHVSLNVSNIDASVSFYEKAFGVEVTKRRPGYAKFDLVSPSLNLTMQVAPRTGLNAAHFGVQVASSEDVAAAWTRFKEAGLMTYTEENTECCYALQDKVWIQDPDGNHWEVFVVKADVATKGQGPGQPEAKAVDASSGGCCGLAKRDGVG